MKEKLGLVKLKSEIFNEKLGLLKVSKITKNEKPVKNIPIAKKNFITNKDKTKKKR